MGWWGSRLGLPVEVLYAVSGLLVGFIVGLTGVGGGSLMTPLLILLFGVPPVTAVGTDLLYASVTKSAGTLVHGFNKSVDWRIVGQLALGSVPAAALTLTLLSTAAPIPAEPPIYSPSCLGRCC